MQIVNGRNDAKCYNKIPLSCMRWRPPIGHGSELARILWHPTSFVYWDVITEGETIYVFPEEEA